MEQYCIESVVDLLSRLREMDPYQMFRGQARQNWALIPAIGRMHELLASHGSWEDLEQALLGRFQKYARPFLDYPPGNKLEWLVIAQHYGLPTRLLDWTTNPLKALFFAVEHPGLHDDAVLWALEPTEWWSQWSDIETRLSRSGAVIAYFPDPLNQRISNQESCFILLPFPADNSPMPPLDRPGVYDRYIKRLVKFTMKAQCREAIRAELQTLGITHRSMFPGLDGLAKSIRREYGLLW